MVKVTDFQGWKRAVTQLADYPNIDKSAIPPEFTKVVTFGIDAEPEYDIYRFYETQYLCDEDEKAALLPLDEDFEPNPSVTSVGAADGIMAEILDEKI